MMFIWSVALIIHLVKKIRISVEEIIGFIFCLLIITAYLRAAGYYRYIFPAQIVAILFLVPSLNIISTRVAKYSKYYRAFLIIPLFVFATFGIYGLTSNSWVADYYDSHKTAFWEEYFANAPVNQSYFFYDVPEIVIFSKTRNYYQYIAPTGGAFSTSELKVLENGITDRVIMPTNTFNDNKLHFEKFYRPVGEAFKYTILNKK